MRGTVVGSLGDQEVSDHLIAVEKGTKEVSNHFEGSLGDQSNEGTTKVSDHLDGSLGDQSDKGTNEVSDHTMHGKAIEKGTKEVSDHIEGL